MTRALTAVIVLALLCVGSMGETIDQAKLKTDEQPVSLEARVVTHTGTGFFYVEEDSRCAGIRVEKDAHTLAAGMRADVAGTMKTDPNGERYILASTAGQSGAPNAFGSAPPLALRNAAIGGSDWRVAGSGGQVGVAASAGLNNIGLLVRTWGRFQQADATAFTLDDGSGHPIRCVVPSGTFLNPGWQYVTVTGVCSLATSGSGRIPIVLVREMEVVSPVESVTAPGTPSGNASPVVGALTTYSAAASTCSHGHPVEYSFNWADGAASDWSPSASASHAWASAGVRTVTVTARCQAHNGVSTISAGLQVSVTPSPYTGQMILIPAGAFDRGTPDSYTAPHNADEHPQHSVTLRDFYIGKYEVTRGEFRQFILAGGYSNQSYWSSDGWAWKLSRQRTAPNYWTQDQNWGTGSFTQSESHPVVGVSYYEAEAFCNWAGGSLPTEAQWEKAARWNGSYSAIYPWGDTWNSEECNNWYDTNAAGGGYGRWQTAPVGSYPAGATHYGCMDMAGNQWEWCRDWYDAAYYSQTPPGGWIDPCGPAGGSTRVLRGGCWSGDYNATMRCALRASYGPDNGWTSFGFRVAR